MVDALSGIRQSSSDNNSPFIESDQFLSYTVSPALIVHTIRTHMPFPVTLSLHSRLWYFLKILAGLLRTIYLW